MHDSGTGLLTVQNPNSRSRYTHEKAGSLYVRRGEIFPKDTEAHKQAYKRLYKAYIAARYDQVYQIE